MDKFLAFTDFQYNGSFSARILYNLGFVEFAKHFHCFFCQSYPEFQPSPQVAYTWKGCLNQQAANSIEWCHFSTALIHVNMIFNWQTMI